MAAKPFRVVLGTLFPPGRVRRDQNGSRYCHKTQPGGTLMRHGSWTAGPVPLLAEGMTPGSLGGLLVAPAGLPDRLTAANRPADLGAITLPPVTAGADADLFPALPAVEDPVALLDGAAPGRLTLDKCGKRANTSQQLSCRAALRRPGCQQPWGLRFFLLCVSFYPIGLPGIERPPLSPTLPPVARKPLPSSGSIKDWRWKAGAAKDYFKKFLKDLFEERMDLLPFPHRPTAKFPHRP